MIPYNKDLPAVHLRAMEPEDLDMLYKIENDMQIWNVGTTNVPYSRYALHEYIASSTGDIYNDRQVRLMIEAEQGEIVGIIDIVNFDPRHLRAEVGIVIESNHRRRGYALAALHQISDYSLNVLHLHQLFAVIDEDNIASLRLFEKAGFEHGGILKDWLFDGRKFKKTLFLQLFL